MPIDKEVRPVPTKADRVSYTVTQELNADGSLAPITATLFFQPLAADGSEAGQPRYLNLLDHATPAQKTSMTTQITALRTKINTEAF